MVSSSHWSKPTIYKPMGVRKSKAKEYDYSQGVGEVTKSEHRGYIEVITAKEVSDLLKVSQWMVYELVKQNEIPHFKVGRSVRFVRGEVVAWMCS